MGEAIASAPLRAVAAAAQRGTRWTAIALGFSLPISTAFDNVLLVLLLLCWLASGGWQAKFARIRANPVAVAALLLLGLLALGTAWGPGLPAERFTYLKKYTDLLLIAILVHRLRRPGGSQARLAGIRRRRSRSPCCCLTL